MQSLRRSGANGCVVDALRNAVRCERRIQPKRDILRQDEVPQHAHLLLTGLAYRFRVLGDGRRQITALIVPGDLCDLEACMNGRAKCGLAAVGACTLGEIPLREIVDAYTAEPRMVQAVWRSFMRDEAIAREWLLNIGQRPALERTAHLFCELRARLQAVGLVSEEGYELRLTQVDLADVLGLTPVHMNRVMRAMRERGLVRLAGGRLNILDVPALEKFAEFDPAYLQVR